MTKAQCKATTAAGDPCGMKPIRGGDYCFNHAPEVAADRAQARKRGGQARHTPHFADPSQLPVDVKTIEDARKLLSYTLAEVVGHDNSLLRARVLLSLFDSFVKSIEIGEIEARLQALEQRGK